MRESDTLLMADCVTSLGGVPLDFDAWGIDYAYSCTQKCLAAPPGMSPIAVSERAMDRVRSRTTPVPFSTDFELLDAYWVERPVTYHHTAPILHIYALHEVLRQTLAEGLEQRWARHGEAGGHLQERAAEAGFELLAEPDHRLAPLTAIRVPEGVDGKAAQKAMLEAGIEVGGGLGPDAPAIWRVGLMGPPTRDTEDRGPGSWGALDGALASQLAGGARARLTRPTVSTRPGSAAGAISTSTTARVRPARRQRAVTRWGSSPASRSPSMWRVATTQSSPFDGAALSAAYQAAVSMQVASAPPCR